MNEMFDIMNWKLPKVKPGDLVRFVYWDSEFKTFKGFRGYITDVRHLSHKPVQQESKDHRPMKRGSALYTVTAYYKGKLRHYSVYNQRVANMEIL